MNTDHEDTRTRLLDAAEELFAQHGFDGATVRMITDRAAANPASINYYFSSKEELFREVVRRKIVSMRELIKAARGADASLEARLKMLLEGVLDRLWNDRGMVRIIADDMVHGRGRVPEVADREIAENVHALSGLLQDAVDQGEIAPCNVRLAVMSIMGALFHVCAVGRGMPETLGLDLNNAADRAVFADHHVNLMLNGLRRADRGEAS